MFNMDNSFTFPLDETYVAFGDDSVNAAGVSYGMALIPQAKITQTEKRIEAAKQKFGGLTAFPIHCRELFNVHARRKGNWSHLTYPDVVALCSEVLAATAASQPKYLLAHIPRAIFPKRFRLKGKDGHPDLVHDIDEKWLTLWAYFRVAGLLDPAETIVPEDPKINPRPLNLPYWHMVMKRSDPGLRVSKVYLDREKTKIRWLSKSVQWMSVARELVVENSTGPTHLPIEHSSNEKHPLVDVADILTYSTARELEGQKPIDYGRFCGEVLVGVLSNLGEEVVFGGSA